jgi:hypothetical protein
LPTGLPTISAVSAGPVSASGATLQPTVNPNGSATPARFQYSTDPAFTPTVAINGNNAIKEVLPNNTIRTLRSGFRQPAGVAVDPAGDAFVADTFNDRAVELSPPTVAATPSPLSGKTAAAVSAALTGLSPATTYYRALASSPAGFVADRKSPAFDDLGLIADEALPASGLGLPLGASDAALSRQIALLDSSPGSL